jgi:hypothetical protein
MPNGNPVGRSFAGAETDAVAVGRASFSQITNWLVREAPRKSGVWENRGALIVVVWNVRGGEDRRALT